jgi:hypothetical protein
MQKKYACWNRAVRWMLKGKCVRVSPLILLVTLTLLPQAHADWSGALSGTGAGAANHSYLDTNNWTSTTLNDTFTSPLTAAATIYFAGDRNTTGAVGVTESGLGIFGTESQSEGSNGLVINQNTNLVLTLAGGGTTNNGVGVTAAAHTMTLGGDVVLNSTVPGAGDAILGGAGTAGLSLNLGGQPRTFFLSNSSQGGSSLQKNMTVASGITNGALIKAGSGRLILQAANTLTGPVTVGWGQSVIGGNNTQCLAFQTAGSLANVGTINVLPSSVISIANQTSTATTRLNSSGTLNLMNALFENLFSQKTSSGQVYSETLSGLNFVSGLDELSQGESGTITSNNLSTINLNLGTVSRLNNSVMFLRNANIVTAVTGALDNPAIGTANNKVAMANYASFLTGGSGAAGSTQLKIIPFMAMHSAILSSTANADTFVTYDTGVGTLRPLSLGAEFRAGLNTAGNTDDNVAAGAGTMAADTTVNSLLITNAATVNLGSKTLTVASGLIGFQTGGTLSTGTNAFGSAEGIIMAMNNMSMTVSCVLTGTGGLTLLTSGSSSASLLSGNNTGLTGTINIIGRIRTSNEQVVNVNANAALGSGSNPLVLHPNVRIQIGQSGAVTSKVASVSGGSFNNPSIVRLYDALDSFTIGSGTTATAGTIRMDGATAFISPGLSGAGTPDLARIGRLDFSGTNTNFAAVQLVNGTVNIDLYAAPKAAGSLVDPVNDMIYAGTSLAFQKGGNLALQVNTLGSYTPTNGATWTIAVAGTNGAVNTVTSSTNLLFDTITPGYSATIGNYGGGVSNAVILSYGSVPKVFGGTLLSVH